MSEILKSLRKPKNVRRLTGLSYNLFTELAKKMWAIWEREEEKRLSGKKRRRKIGGGRKYKLRTMEEKLLLLLFFYKYHMTYALLECLFGIDASNLNRLVRRLVPMLEEAADENLILSLEERYEQLEPTRSMKDALRRHPEFRIAVSDATEQKCYRPKNTAEQKKSFSGKKKQHTIKTQITVTSERRIINVSKSVPGSCHDKKLIDSERTAASLPEQVWHILDAGYDGLPKDNPDHAIAIPFKKRRNKKELSEKEKCFNKDLSKARIIVEHAFADMKHYKILGELFRSSKRIYNAIFRSIAALINFRRFAM